MYSPLNLFGYWTLNKHYYYYYVPKYIPFLLIFRIYIMQN